MPTTPRKPFRFARDKAADFTPFANALALPGKPHKVAAPVATEDQEQIALFEWAARMVNILPGIEWMYAIPNGGSRHPAEAKKLKRSGVKAGVSDIFLPVARGGEHGLYIEMKRTKGYILSKGQADFGKAMVAQGYAFVVCPGWVLASETITKYMMGEKDHG